VNQDLTIPVKIQNITAEYNIRVTYITDITDVIILVC